MSEKLYGTGIRLPPLDNLFSTEDERQDAKLEKIQDLPIAALHPFRGHPFSVREDEEMQTISMIFTMGSTPPPLSSAATSPSAASYPNSITRGSETREPG